MKRRRRILYISGSRADYGMMKNTLLMINNNPNLELRLIVTGMHLMDEFGKSVNEIKRDGFIFDKIAVKYKYDDKISSATFVGEFTKKLADVINDINPNIILIQGDRAEMLAGAIVGTYMSIPIAHIHGGDVSGHVDDPVRHAITKLANIHFASTRRSAERIIRMGEEGWRVHIVGAPGLDSIVRADIDGRKVAEKYNLDVDKPIVLVVQHPVNLEEEMSDHQMRETMEAIDELGFQTIVIYPNADAGGRKMIDVIESYRDRSFIQIYKNLAREDYLGLMRISDVIVGNSSSAIIEAPCFGLPAVNIGTRQQGRERCGNVIDVDYDKISIKKAIAKALNKNFRGKMKHLKNPYGDGKSGERISEILASISLDKKLLQKKMTY